MIPSVHKTSGDKAYRPPESLLCGIILRQFGVAGAMIQQREVRANMGLRELEFPFFFTFFL
jgi:hypothetical protein